MNLLYILKRFVPKYRWNVFFNVLFNFLATLFSLISFAAIIPILRIIFGLNTEQVAFQPYDDTMSFKEWTDALSNNFYYLMQTMIEEHGAMYVLVAVGCVLIVFAGLKVFSSFFAMFFLVPIRTGVVRDIRLQLFEKVINLPIGYFTEEKKGDVMSRMTNDVGEVENSIMASLEMVLKDPVMIIIYLVTLFILSWQLTLFVFLLLPISGWLIGKAGRSLKKQSTTAQEQTGEITSQIEESLGGLRVVKAFRAEHKLIYRFDQLINETRNTFNRVHRRYALAHPISEFLGTILVAILLWYGGSLILADKSPIDAAVFIYYLVIFYSIINPAKDLSRATYSVKKGIASLERIDKVLNTPNNITNPEHPVSIPKTEDKKPFVTYENVSFEYQQGTPVLQNINLEIYKGQTVAFVGQSGSGKTSLVDLLPRFYDVNDGKICINGEDIRHFKVSDLRGLMGNVNQEAILFNDSFFNNIAFGVDTTAMDSETLQQEVIRAAQIANAHEFIIQTPDGYQTKVGDRGSRLSGGQRQRISIARAILKNPDILILDEATSALDTESEKLVQDALDHLMKGRTTLVVAHRLSTIRNADLIVVLHEGKIVEQGTHDTLVAKKGYYNKLLTMQNMS